MRKMSGAISSSSAVGTPRGVLWSVRLLVVGSSIGFAIYLVPRVAAGNAESSVKLLKSENEFFLREGVRRIRFWARNGGSTTLARVGAVRALTDAAIRCPTVRSNAVETISLITEEHPEAKTQLCAHRGLKEILETNDVGEFARFTELMRECAAEESVRSGD